MSLYGYTVKMQDSKPVDVEQIKPLLREENNVVLGLYNVDNYPRITRILTFLEDIRMGDLGMLFFLMLCRATKDHPDLKQKIDSSLVFQHWIKTQPYLANKRYEAEEALLEHELEDWEKTQSSEEGVENDAWFGFNSPVVRGCQWIDPKKTTGRYVTGSYVASAELVRACMIFDMDPHALISAWHRMLRSVAIPAHNEVKHKSLTERVIHVTNAIAGQGKCFDDDSNNFLYDLFMYNQCNCMCSSLLIYAIFEVLEPQNISKFWFVIIPRHIYILLRDKKGRLPVWNIIEGTSFNKGEVITEHKTLSAEEILTNPATFLNDPAPVVFLEMVRGFKKKIRKKVPYMIMDLLQNTSFCSHSQFSEIICVYLKMFLQMMKDIHSKGLTKKYKRKFSKIVALEPLAYTKTKAEFIKVWKHSISKQQRKELRKMYERKFPGSGFHVNKMRSVIVDLIPENTMFFDCEKYEPVNEELKILWEKYIKEYMFETYPPITYWKKIRDKPMAAMIFNERHMKELITDSIRRFMNYVSYITHNLTEIMIKKTGNSKVMMQYLDGCSTFYPDEEYISKWFDDVFAKPIEPVKPVESKLISMMPSFMAPPSFMRLPPPSSSREEKYNSSSDESSSDDESD